MTNDRPLNQVDDQADAEHAETELSPEAQKVIAGARRRFAFSMTILLIGFVAVVGALVYRANRSEPSSTAHYAELINLPQGAQFISASSVGDRIMIVYQREDQQIIGWYAPDTGEQLGETVIAIVD